MYLHIGISSYYSQSIVVPKKGILQWYQRKIFGSACGFKPKCCTERRKVKMMKNMGLFSFAFRSKKNLSKEVEQEEEIKI